MRNIAISCLVFLSISAFSETIKIGSIDTEQVVNNLPQYQQSVLEISNFLETETFQNRTLNTSQNPLKLSKRSDPAHTLHLIDYSP